MTQTRLHADVLVIGGGMAGAWAASAAARAGASVALVDKGYCGTSGVTATAGPGHWWVPPDSEAPGARAQAIAAKMALAQGLADANWMERIIDQTWRTLPTLAAYYDFQRNEAGVIQYRALRGPEYMRALRAYITTLGVQILDHHPALELLRGPDGGIAGARGWARQGLRGPWQITAGAVVLATGGTSFRSRLLGAHNNTGDGYLMAAEAGAQLSGLEFTGIYTVAPAGTPMTRAMAYAWADYFDESGRQIDVQSGDATRSLAKALMQGKVVCSLARMPEDLRAHVHTISPNVTTAWTRQGIDPWNDRFEVTLHGDGTIRGPGGVRVVDEDCGVGVPGLYAVGDAASRELITGANSGGGAQNAAWALSSGVWAGQAAARHAMQRGLRKAGPGRQGLEALGRVGLRPAASAKALDVKALIAAVQAQVLPYERNLFRTSTGLAQSGRALDEIWAELHDHAGGSLDASAVWSGAGDALLRVREAAALAATARWSVAAAQARTESRGPLHRREDFPETDARQAHRLRVQGLGKGADAMRVWPDAQVDTARQGLEALETA